MISALALAAAAVGTPVVAPAVAPSSAATPATAATSRTPSRNAERADSAGALTAARTAAESTAGEDNAKATASESLAIRLCTELFLPLIRSLAAADPGLYSQALRSLQTVLSSTTRDSLQDEPPNVLAALRTLLLTALTPGSAADANTQALVRKRRAEAAFGCTCCV